MNVTGTWPSAPAPGEQPPSYTEATGLPPEASGYSPPPAPFTTEEVKKVRNPNKISVKKHNIENNHKGSVSY